MFPAKCGRHLPSSAAERGWPPSRYVRENNRNGENPMWFKTSLAVLGMTGALAAVSPTPVVAQGVYIGPGGVGVDVGRPGWRERRDRADRDYAYERDNR